MKHNSKITFIICTYNRSGYLDDTLRSLLRHNLLDIPVSILVVDNNSTDDTAAVVQRHQKACPKDEHPIRYIKEPKQGLSYARNCGISEAQSPYVVFLDDDIRATESLVSAWLAFFDNHPHAVAAGGKIHVQFDDPRPEWMSRFLLPLLGHHDLGRKQKAYPSNKYPFGGNMGFKKSIFDAAGRFDTDLGRKGQSLNAGEEKELFRRLRALDEPIYYLPEAFLYHRVNAGRLTVEYIRKQAIGLGKSMRLQLKAADLPKKVANGISEIGKWIASLPLGLFYCLQLQPAKAAMLFKFRKWIAEGYFNATEK